MQVLKNDKISITDLEQLRSHKDVEKLISEKGGNPKAIFKNIKYEKELLLLQKELIDLQNWVQEENQRVAIIFEGRDAAGKGGAIRRFTEHLNPRAIRVVALPKPTEIEKQQWYFQRYIQQLPNPGEIVFFDRSWYNRAIVEPVNGFCTEEQYRLFMQQVPEFELMLYEDGITIIKFWFSITKNEQLKRFEKRKNDPLKTWKLSSVDNKAQDLWERYTQYKEEMFVKTHSSFNPWIIVRTNNKKQARLESIKYVLSTIPYTGSEKPQTNIYPNPKVITRFYRQIVKRHSQIEKPSE